MIFFQFTRFDKIRERVVAVAFTDSVHSLSYQSSSKSRDWFISVSTSILSDLKLSIESAFTRPIEKQPRLILLVIPILITYTSTISLQILQRRCQKSLGFFGGGWKIIRTTSYERIIPVCHVVV